MDKTESNLQTAFAEESQAYIRYTFFALKAEMEGLGDLARLFRAAAEAEMVHARNHFSVMGGIGASKDNLLAAATSEHSQVTRLYPAMIDQAQSDRNERAESTFKYALKAEQGHNSFFETGMQTLKSGGKFDTGKYLVCHICGNLVAGQAPAKCPVCSSPSKEYKEVE